MLIVEGKPKSVSLLLRMLYNLPEVDNATWTITHREPSRMTYIEEVAKRSDASMRQGIGFTSDHTFEVTKNLASTLKLTANEFSVPTRGSKAQVA